MMCHWKPANETHRTGRQIDRRCRRWFCGVFGLAREDGGPVDSPQCRGFPHWYELGYWLDGWLRVFWITKASVKQVINCNCEANEKSLNEAGSVVAKTWGLEK